MSLSHSARQTFTVLMLLPGILHSVHAQEPPATGPAEPDKASLEALHEKSKGFMEEAYKQERAGDHAGALRFYLDGIAFSRKHWGADHEWTAITEAHAANACLNLGKPREGWPLIDHAMPVLQKLYGMDGVPRFLFVHGYEQCAIGRRDEGVAEMERAMALLQKDAKTDPAVVLEQAVRMTSVFHGVKLWKKTLTATRLALDLIEASHGKEAAMNALQIRALQADALYEEKQRKEARAIYEEVMPKLKQQNSPANKNFLGDGYYRMLDLYSYYTEKAALDALRQEAGAFVDAHLNTPVTAVWQIYLPNQLAAFDASENEFGKARVRYQQALNAARASGGRRLVLSPLSGLALCDYREGHSAKAIAMHLELIKMAEESLDQDMEYVAEVEWRLASIYGDLRDTVQAMPHSRRSLALYRKSLGNDAPILMRPMIQLGNLEYNAGNTAAAFSLLKEGSRLAEKHFTTHAIDCLQLADTLAYLLRKQGDYATAVRELDRMIPAGVKVLGADHDELAPLYANRSMCYRDMHKYEEARAEAARALAIKERTTKGQWDGMANDYRNLLAYATWNTGKSEASRELVRQSIPSYLARFHHLLTFTSENQRRALVMNLSAEDLPANFGMAEETAHIILNTKGMVMESLMRDMRTASLSKDPQIVSALKTQREIKARLREIVRKQNAAENGRPPGPGLKSVQEELEQSEQALFSLLKREAHQILQTTQVASALPPGSALLDWFHYRWHPKEAGSDQAYGLVVYQPGKKPALYHLGRIADLDARVADFFISLGAKDDKEVQSTAAKLLSQLLGDAADSLTDVKTLYLCPDETLHLVPFAILPDDKGRLFAERFTLRQLASARDVLVSTSALQPSGTVDILADPEFAAKKEAPSPLPALPGARTEAQNLEKMAHAAGMQCHTLLGAEATKSALQSLHSPDILHLGTHGYYDSTSGENLPDQVYSGLNFGLVSRIDQPMERSGIAMADVAGRSDDSRLSASEAAELDLNNTWLVTIGACNTAMGALRTGDGVASIQHGLQVAGAWHVMAPLWSVGDQITARFMEDFYRDVFAGKTAADAFQHTQLKHFRSFEKVEGYRKAVFKTGGWLLLSKGR